MSTKKSGTEVTFQGESKITKALKWGAALVVSFTAAFVQGSPLKNISNDFSLPTEFGGIIVGVVLLIFLSSKNRKTKPFTIRTTVILISITVAFFILNTAVAGLMTVNYPPVSMQSRQNDSLKRTYLIGLYKTPEASIYQDTARKKVSNSELLYEFNTNIEHVWSSGSILISKILIYIVYICSLVSVSLSIVAGYDISQGKKQRKKRTHAATHTSAHPSTIKDSEYHE